MKFVLIIVVVLLAWRLLSGRWPWQSRRRPRKRESVAHARSLLAVGPGASRQEILEAYRRRLAAVHPDRGGSNEAVHQVIEARDTLLAELQLSSQENS